MHMKAKWCLEKTPLRTPDGSNFDLSTSSTGNRTVPSIFTGLKSLADCSSISSHWNFKHSLKWFFSESIDSLKISGNLWIHWFLNFPYDSDMSHGIPKKLVRYFQIFANRKTFWQTATMCIVVRSAIFWFREAVSMLISASDHF